MQKKVAFFFLDLILKLTHNSLMFSFKEFIANSVELHFSKGVAGGQR